MVIKDLNVSVMNEALRLELFGCEERIHIKRIRFVIMS